MSVALNLDNGEGYSVLQVLEMAKQVTKKSFKVREAPRRPGDPARLVADASLARKLLKWQPEYGLEEIVRHAWAWEEKLHASASG